MIKGGTDGDDTDGGGSGGDIRVVNGHSQVTPTTDTVTLFREIE